MSDDESEEQSSCFEKAQTQDLNLQALPDKEALELLGKKHGEVLAANEKLSNQLNLERIKTSQLENKLSLGNCPNLSSIVRH